MQCKRHCFFLILLRVANAFFQRVDYGTYFRAYSILDISSCQLMIDIACVTNIFDKILNLCYFIRSHQTHQPNTRDEMNHIHFSTNYGY